MEQTYQTQVVITSIKFQIKENEVLNFFLHLKNIFDSHFQPDSTFLLNAYPDPGIISFFRSKLYERCLDPDPHYAGTGYRRSRSRRLPKWSCVRRIFKGLEIFQEPRHLPKNTTKFFYLFFFKRSGSNAIQVRIRSRRKNQACTVSAAKKMLIPAAETLQQAKITRNLRTKVSNY